MAVHPQMYAWSVLADPTPEESAALPSYASYTKTGLLNIVQTIQVSDLGTVSMDRFDHHRYPGTGMVYEDDPRGQEIAGCCRADAWRSYHFCISTRSANQLSSHETPLQLFTR
jgi:hypothetical protein